MRSRVSDPRTRRDVEPVPSSERLEVVDVLRGFALLGVLITNVYSFNLPPDGYIGDYSTSTILDNITYWFVRVFVKGKFYTLFSFMFGLSFALQISRLKSQGAPVVRLYTRRLAILLAIGLLHSIFIWAGDILKFYALLGFPLLLFRDVRPRRLLTWALALLSVFYLGVSGAYVVMNLTPREKAEARADVPEEQEPAEDEASEAYQSGGYLEVTARRARILVSSENLSYLVAGLIYVLPTFLVGAYAGQRGLFHHLQGSAALLRKLLRWGLAVGLVSAVGCIALGLATSGGNRSAARALMGIAEQVTAPALATAIVASLALLYRQRIGQQLLNPLASIGRTALSNYVLQSVVFTLLFYGYGLALMGQMGITTLFALSVAFYVAQVVVSSWWTRRVRFGPLEWVWRSLTYGAVQPMRRHFAETPATHESRER